MLRLDWYLQVIWSQCEGVIFLFSFLFIFVEGYTTVCHKAAGPTVLYILFGYRSNRILYFILFLSNVGFEVWLYVLRNPKYLLLTHYELSLNVLLNTTLQNHEGGNCVS